MIKKIIQLKNKCWLALKCLYQDQVSHKAMALAYTTLLSLVPLITLVLYFFTLYFEDNHIDLLTRKYLANNFLPHANLIIVNYLRTFSERAFSLSIFNIMFFFISAIWLVITIEKIMSYIWKESYTKLNFLSLIIYTLTILIIPFLILIISLLSYALTFIITHIFAWNLLLNLVPLTLNTLVFSLLYTLTAKVHHLKFHNALCGGFIAALLLEFSKSIFTLYIKYFSNYELIYGTLSILPVFALWIYIFWLITLYGVLIVKIQYSSKKY